MLTSNLKMFARSFHASSNLAILCESCRQDVEDRKLIRLGEESSITTEQIVEGVALGELLPEGNGSGDNVEHIGVKFSGKKVD
ncbi:uncharacterized protein L3040_008522 [Drepanopeziza brunnea f. sp. 'multigermtubi']|uniref:uncharacterized protein n=1 Tax=Drepanopeziza brunnea f. sp. 'multigermtubi' TaxID=698441 RepID=UPI00239AD870|nr:hypothetical protein L3040_008522 [Drepanopeziza brunnea f. sp. 'multigermtubi']